MCSRVWFPLASPGGCQSLCRKLRGNILSVTNPLHQECALYTRRKHETEHEGAASRPECADGEARLPSHPLPHTLERSLQVAAPERE